MYGKEIEFYFEREFGRRIGKKDRIISHNNTQIGHAHYTIGEGIESTANKLEGSEEGNERNSLEDEEERIAREYRDSTRSNLLMMIYGVIIFFWMATLFVSCSTTKYVPVGTESSMSDSIATQHTGTARDSIVMSDTTSKRDSIAERETIHAKDSVLERDSIVHVVDESGNIIKEKHYHSKEVNHYKEKEVSSYKEKETISQLEKEVDRLREELSVERAKKSEVREIPIIIEKELSRWQKIKLQAGEFLIIAILVIGAIYVRKFVKTHH